MNVDAMAREARRNSEHWFPNLYTCPPIPLDTYFALALAGEVGELCNLMKKVHRRTKDAVNDEMAEELADIFTYLLLLADELGISLVDAFQRKQQICHERWDT